MAQLLLLLGICCTSLAETTTPTLRLLALIPLAETTELSDHLPLLTAGQLAVDKINTRNDILPDYKLELVPANTETCNHSLVTEALGNFVRHVTDRDGIVGVVGITVFHSHPGSLPNCRKARNRPPTDFSRSHLSSIH